MYVSLHAMFSQQFSTIVPQPQFQEQLSFPSSQKFALWGRGWGPVGMGESTEDDDDNKIANFEGIYATRVISTSFCFSTDSFITTRNEDCSISLV